MPGGVAIVYRLGANGHLIRIVARWPAMTMISRAEHES
jgi:hypothetical protein